MFLLNFVFLFATELAREIVIGLFPAGKQLFV